MNGPAGERPLDWAALHRPDRTALAAVLGVRPLLYSSEGAAPTPPVQENLVLAAIGCDERPTFHSSTGLYGFIRLPPGPRRIEISDPARRVLPWAITADVPDRSAIRAALERGDPPPPTPRPRLVDVGLRPAPGAPLPPGLTAIWGMVRQSADGAPVALARIACATAGGRTVVTYAERDGGFVIALPAERPASLVTPPMSEFPRALALHAPKPPLAAALTRAAFIAALPADLDAIDPDAPTSPFAARHFRLRKADGTLLAGTDPDLPVRAAERSRWDIELLP